MLKEPIIHNQIALKFSVMGIVAATSVLLAFLSVPSMIPGQVSAQITPSGTPGPSNVGIGFAFGFMAQDSADPVQNSTSANITQLATIPPTANQPITPAALTPVSEVSDDSDDSSSSNDDDSDDSSSSNDDDDDSDGGSSAFAGGGGAFASAG
ncbi:MAG: hypothetical protein ACM3X1_04305 [Ignavibacteriales bacterium]